MLSEQKTPDFIAYPMAQKKKQGHTGRQQTKFEIEEVCFKKKTKTQRDPLL